MPGRMCRGLASSSHERVRPLYHTVQRKAKRCSEGPPLANNQGHNGTFNSAIGIRDGPDGDQRNADASDLRTAESEETAQVLVPGEGRPNK